MVKSAVYPMSYFMLLLSFLYIPVFCSNQEGPKADGEPPIKHPKHQPQQNDLGNENDIGYLPESDKVSDENIDGEARNELNKENLHGGIESVSEGENIKKGIVDQVFDMREKEAGNINLRSEEAAKEIVLSDQTVNKSNIVSDESGQAKTEDTGLQENDDTEKEIPSFKEYREQKEKEDKETGNEEKRKTESTDETVVEKPKGKLIQKNYADSSCGANIVEKKNGFKNCDTILNNNKDLYGMIACEGSIWFIVELCDTVQIQAIQLANHELFSSSIREFKIYTSENYPPKEWALIGTFETVNNRDLQKFDIDNHGEYSKYVKFEKVSFRGKEHFCVLTKFAVMGISMVDEYEEQQMPQDVEIDPYEKPINEIPEEITDRTNDKSIIEGAKDAVKNIVDSALNVLGVSTNGDKTAQSDTKKINAGEAANKSEESVPLPPTEESVVAKIDETGKEIKEAPVKETGEKRLKGEVAEQVDMRDHDDEKSRKGDASVATNIPQQESIMEGVDLSAGSDEEKDQEGDVHAKPENTQSDADKKGELDETREAVENLEKLADEAIMKTASGDKKEDQEKDGKGVVMTNSPKKNSIFVDLDKKIRDLQKDLSLSNDYLETLSSRYKRVDNLFKPLEKTLSTVDAAIVDFEKRLKSLEGKFEKVDDVVDAYLNRMNELNNKSNTLITTTNLAIFLLLIMLWIFWRTSNKVQQILAQVTPKGKQSPSVYEKSSATSEPIQQPPKRLKSKSKDVVFKKQDNNADPIKSSFSDMNIIPHSRSQLFSVENRKTVDNKKTLQSVQMDLIHPQSKSPTLKRRASKGVR